MDTATRLTMFFWCGLIIGCAATEPESQPREQHQKNPRTAPLAVYERDFTPSHYDIAIGQVESSSQRYIAGEQDTIATAVNPTSELTPGFRVQVMFSNSIDDATKVKSEVALLFPADIVYTLYDSPYYKVRVGDYQERNTAAQALKILIEKGYTQSWIVPDRVQKNPLKPSPAPMK